jgi:hypothetical protein
MSAVIGLERATVVCERSARTGLQEPGLGEGVPFTLTLLSPAPQRRNYGRHFHAWGGRTVGGKLRWVQENHTALAIRAERRLVARAGLTQYADAVVAAEAAEATLLTPQDSRATSAIAPCRCLSQESERNGEVKGYESGEASAK